MFPSSDNPLFQFPQHLYISSSSFGQIQSNNNFIINETLFHHHHQNQILNQIFEDAKQENDGVPNNSSDGPTKVTLASENMNDYVEKNQYAPLDIIPARLQPPGKKDRHSKIVTAQGPRDRRVRLSIDIAKKFFGLQDMLGYDKASKTLDWLLTKSKMAIEEVAQSKKKNTHMVNYASESDPDKMMINDLTFAKDISGQGTMSAKESNRIKARERARERTRRKKMCILAEHKQSDNTIISPSTSNSNQSLPVRQKGACKISDVDYDMNCQVFSNICPQISSYKELSQMKKNKFVSTSSVYGGPSGHSCPEDHFLPCTSTANWDTSTQRVFQLCGQTNFDMPSTNRQL